MPKFIIKSPKKKDLLYIINHEQTKIGRGDECEMILPNISVSRVHAVVEKQGSSYQISDMGSENGFRVGNETKDTHILSSRDEVSIGQFTLIFLSDSPEDQSYRGQSLSFLTRYSSGMNEKGTTQHKTFQMSPAEARKLLNQTSKLNKAFVVDGNGSKHYPDANPLTFGGGGAKIKVDGLIVFGTFAEITWDGNNHVLEKKSFLATVVVNREKIQRKILKAGDIFKIGRSVFRYKLDD